MAPDLIYHNGVVLTMEPGRQAAQALAVQAGKILAVGTNADALALAAGSTHVLDLRGRTVLPGFNDAHCHRIGDRDVAGSATPQDAIAATLTSA
jgi:predicted amidohydrolase YtcJ